MIAEFKQAAAEVKPAPAGGAIFGSRSRPQSGQWLTIDMTNNNSGIDGWGKTSTITVYNEKLKTDPKFRLYWTRLQDIAKSGDLAQLSDQGPVQSAYKANTLQYLRQALRREPKQ